MTRALLLLFLTCGTVFAQTNKYTDAMYRRALEKQSTSPLFVLVSLRGSETNTERMVCVAASSLLGAIHMEHHIDYDEPGVQKALALAIAQPGKVFSFADSQARRFARPSYSPEVLSEVRQLIGSKSDAQLRDEVLWSNSPLNQIYATKKNGAQHHAYRAAVAHILLERGILVGISDMGAFLYLEKDA